MSLLTKNLVPSRYKVPVMLGLLLLSISVALWLNWPEDEILLGGFERRIYSQFGEDGVIEKIFEIVPPGPRFVVEFGSSDGVTGSNSRNLILHHEFGALLMEGDEEMARQGAEAYAELSRVTAIQAWVYPGNIEILLEDHGVPQDLDLISIDIDSNDYYVWRALHDFRPKVVLIEVNGSFPPPQRVVVKFSPFNYWDGTDYYGASIQSLYELGKKKGYELVHADSHGANLFFVDEKYYPRFHLVDNSPRRMYQVPRYGHHGRAPNGRGWPAFDEPITHPDGTVEAPNLTLEWDAFEVEKEWVRDLP